MRALYSELVNLWSLLTTHELTRENQAQALLRFVRWQIASRAVRQPILMPYVNSSRLLVSKGMTGATGNIYAGLLEFQEMGFLLHFLRRDDLFADVGANVGVYTILASAAVGARSVSVEPLAAAMRSLDDNVRINDIGGLVSRMSVGIADAQGQLRFTADLDTMNRVVPEGTTYAGETSIIDVLTVDDLFPAEQPTILKLDVEGYEWPALKGASGVLASKALKALIVEINGSGSRYGVTDDEVHRHVVDYGFTAVSYSPIERQLMPLETYGPTNTIYVRDLDEARDRVAQGAAFTVQGRRI